jgi:OHCU decarboxylase
MLPPLATGPKQNRSLLDYLKITPRFCAINYAIKAPEQEMQRYPRNMIGYGANPPDAAWPGGAKIAVSLVLNYEEGGENNILHGDAASEAFLSDIPGAAPWPGQRHWNMESIYEYGARAGFWRLHRLFTSMDIPVTIYGVATALARSPEQVAAMKSADWEIASHGLKWVEHRDMPEEEERRQIAEAVRLHTEVVGARPTGWYTGRCSVNTVRLTAEAGFDWISDTYDDDLPYWIEAGDRDQLVIPYTLEANDMRFATAPGYIEGEQFFTYLKDAFDELCREGAEGRAKMMSVGLHCRLIGRPGKIAGLRRFLEYAKGHEGVWFPRRIDIARHWAVAHPPVQHDRPSRMEKAEFVAAYGVIFEHSAWIAERAFDLELGPAHDTALGLHNALCRMFRSASDTERLGVLTAHPDLAGKLAQAKRLTAESTSEQAGAGLNALTDDERETFTRLNTEYVAKHGFPFIIAVRDHTKASILGAFHRRIGNDRATEFAEACRQVERIAEFRLKDILP